MAAARTAKGGVEKERQHPRLDDRRHGEAAPRLGGGDRIGVDQYLDSVREVERRIQSAGEGDAAALDLDRPASVQWCGKTTSS